MLRENQRLLQRAMRDLDRERMNMEKQEKQIIADIKKMAKKNEMATVKIMAKDLVRTRNTCKKFMLMRANIQAVSLKISTIKSQHAMSEAMKGVTKAMGRMNKTMKLPQIQKIMQEFEKQSEIMDMKEEMMNDVMDDAMGGSDDEEETENLVNKVLDELGLENMVEVGAIPSAVGEPTPAQSEEPSADLDADLEARLNNLRR
ncbi:Oidioi.mRNA.OKI2018_I69.PAR.g12566.t1.cds [Oikopleura dioica]|uniref:Oidioi.mRNA.OKI2018_I69.PAR.g12566.t1.cds n=1 Tax=Oikopleura dioica TaxID=34765 RepID=A0ABN7S134_OIKDI|nr:Oidioi.mRNA.OKI2018_I69.PAR.g12566.t1.cds [Oikopleura dioica]